jgi:broad specificity phosphatase PhoE
MPLIHLVRHGEPSGTWGQHPDPGLSDLGHRQAAQAASLLADSGARLLVSSPLMRCRETAAPTEHMVGHPARIEPRVAEVSVPAGTADARDWLMALLGGKWAGSGLEAWRDQVGAALLELPADTIVFSHFVAINAAVSLATQADDVTVFRPGHASVTTLDVQGGALSLVQLGSEDAVRLT